MIYYRMSWSLSWAYLQQNKEVTKKEVLFLRKFLVIIYVFATEMF